MTEAKTKTHHGRITEWRKHFPLDDFEPPEGALGYIILGRLIDHPDWKPHGNDPWYRANTSWVLTHDEATGEIETQNSRYTLVGEAGATTDARSK